MPAFSLQVHGFWRRWLVILLILLPALYFVYMAFMYFFQDRIIFPGAGRPEATPAKLQMAFEEIRLDTPDGATLAAWFMPGAAHPADGVAPAGPRKPCVFMCEGNAENRGTRLDQIFYWQRLGISTFIWDYRGFGDSTGRPTLRITSADVKQAFEALLARPDIDPTRIVFDGHSLGTGVVTSLLPDFHPAAIVLEAGYSSIARAAQDQAPLLPVRWLLKDNYDNVAKLQPYDGPVLIMSSRRDELFNQAHAQRLHQACKNGTLVWDNGAHPDQRQGGEYGTVIEAFLMEAGVIAGEAQSSPPRHQDTK